MIYYINSIYREDEIELFSNFKRRKHTSFKYKERNFTPVSLER